MSDKNVTEQSDSDSDENDSIDFVFYRDREDWKDIKPVPQDEGKNPVVAINYSPKFRDVYDYFRAVLRANEYSERALELTKDALVLNAANYTVWQYRRMILQKLNKDLDEELTFSAAMIKRHPKNYQVWHHRMVIVQWMNNPGMELHFIAHMLCGDAKNYHAWTYRQWILTTFKSSEIFEQELDYTTELISQDVRNNSVWNHRYFVINHSTDFDEETINKEIDFTLNQIDLVKKNESSWSYLRGLLIHSKHGLLEPNVMKYCENLYTKEVKSTHLLAYLIDAAGEMAEINPGTQETTQLLGRAYKMCIELAEKLDSIRHKYWTYVSKTIESKMTQS